MTKFRKVDRNLDTMKELDGKQVFFAVYAESMMGEAKLLVDTKFAEIIDCGAPLDRIISSFRSAILDAARAHGNTTVPRA